MLRNVSVNTIRSENFNLLQMIGWMCTWLCSRTYARLFASWCYYCAYLNILSLRVLNFELSNNKIHKCCRKEHIWRLFLLALHSESKLASFFHCRNNLMEIEKKQQWMYNVHNVSVVFFFTWVLLHWGVIFCKINCE